MTPLKPDATELWLLRHGQTDWNVEGRYQGQADIPLNETGQLQALEAAEQIAGQALRFSALYSSDLQRAYQTAAAISQRLNLPVNPDSRLREIHLGSWEGMLHKDVTGKERFYGSEEDHAIDPKQAQAPGGETILTVADRVSQCVSEIQHRHPGERVIVVAHGLVIACLMCQARGLPLRYVHQQDIKNAQAFVVTWPPAFSTGCKNGGSGPVR